MHSLSGCEDAPESAVRFGSGPPVRFGASGPPADALLPLSPLGPRIYREQQRGSDLQWAQRKQETRTTGHSRRR